MTTTRNTTPLEDDECKVFHQWLELKHIPHTHIANESRGGTRAAMIRGAKLKAMGQSAGYWDYDLYLPITGITGEVDAYQLVKIEMKRKKGGVISADQKRWGDIFELAGIPCAVCRGADEAIKQVESWLKEIAG